MRKISIRLLVTLALTATAVTAGWSHASSSSRPETGLSASRMSRPPVAIYNGEPDPGSAPVPKLIASRDSYTSQPFLSLASRIWAMWYLKTGW